MNETHSTVIQSYRASRPPEAKDPTAMMPKMMKSLSDCTRVFSSGRWHSSTRADAVSYTHLDVYKRQRMLKRRIELFLSLPHDKLDALSLQAELRGIGNTRE